MESMKQELREKSAELNNLKNNGTDMAVLKVSQSKSPIRARLDYDDERDNERDNDSCSESEESGDADFSITIKQDVQNGENRKAGKGSDARSLIRQNKIEREAAGGRLTSNSSDDYVHPSEQKHRHDKIKRANEALRHQKDKSEKSEKTEKQEKSQKSSGKASIFDRIKQDSHRDSNRDSNRDSRRDSREHSPELPVVDKKRRRIIIQNKNERTNSPTVDEAAPLPPHSILQGTDSSKSDKSLKRRKVAVNKRGSTDLDSTDTDSSLKRQRANKPLPGSDRKPEKPVVSTKSESNTLLLKPKPKLVMSGLASNNTVISTESQNYLKKSQLQINQTLNVQKRTTTRKASEENDTRSMRKCSVNSEALDSAVDQHLGEVGERIMAKSHKSVIKPKNVIKVQNGEEGEIDDDEVPTKPKRHASTTSDGNHDVLNLHDEDPDEEALLRELDDYLND